MPSYPKLDRRLCQFLVVAVVVTLGTAQSASADWYSGDPYAAQTAWPQYTDNLSTPFQTLAMTFDNFTWVPGAGGGVVDRVGGHFTNLTAGGGTGGVEYDTAYWEIRTGMADMVAGTLLYSGNASATWYPTAFTQGGYVVWGMDVDVPDFALSAGNYWFGLAIGASNGLPQGAFVASTSGANGIGGPLGDDVSIYYQINNNVIGWNYFDSATFMIPNGVFTGFDPSYYINEVPEPGTIALAGLAAGAPGHSPPPAVSRFAHFDAVAGPGIGEQKIDGFCPLSASRIGVESFSQRLTRFFGTAIFCVSTKRAIARRWSPHRVFFWGREWPEAGKAAANSRMDFECLASLCPFAVGQSTD